MMTTAARGVDPQGSKEETTTSVSLIPSPSLNVHDYTRIFIPCYNPSGDLRIAIRSYTCNDQSFLLAVDPYTFSTECQPDVHYLHRKKEAGSTKPIPYTQQELDKTPYLSALNQYTSAPYLLRNHGLTQSKMPIPGIILTIDMCPSVKPFEGAFFKKLAEYSSSATPIAICITGWWIMHHEQEFAQLIEEEKAGKLKITWVNHTFSHVVTYADLSGKIDYKKNFLLTERTNLTHELMTVEKMLIKHYQTPSVFFRAPGLVSDKKVIRKLNQYGLIPVGSQAWLAEGEEAKEGSIVLVHGNSNEPEGIKKMMAHLEQAKFKLFPLASALVTKIKILNLREIADTSLSKEYLAQIIEWHFQAWGATSGRSKNEIESAIQTQFQHKTAEFFVALAPEAKEILGTISLKQKNMEDEYPDQGWGPWLSGLYVCEKSRKLGLSAILALRALEFAMQTGNKEKIYYFTHHQELSSYYNKLSGTALKPSMADHYLYRGKPILLYQAQILDVLNKIKPYLSEAKIGYDRNNDLFFIQQPKAGLELKKDIDTESNLGLSPS